jgi:hypothetical protein
VDIASTHDSRLNGVARTTRPLGLGLTPQVLSSREMGLPRVMGPLLGTGRNQEHREGPDKPPHEQADQEASEEVVAHDVVTMTHTTMVIPFTRPPGVVRC